MAGWTLFVTFILTVVLVDDGHSVIGGVAVAIAGLICTAAIYYRDH